jgi:hypothetical protein
VLNFQYSQNRPLQLAVGFPMKDVRFLLRRHGKMSKRIDKSWLVFTSIENFDHDKCVDLFSRPDGSFGFEEFRRDPEDRGEWTPVKY